MTEPEARIYHLVQAALWQQAIDSDTAYFPPTYAQDGFIHATAQPALLLEVANHFYQDVPDAFLCLEMTVASVQATGTRVVFEAPAPVGDKPADFDSRGETEFPHLYGGLSPSAVVAAHAVTRGPDGCFTGIDNIC